MPRSTFWVSPDHPVEPPDTVSVEQDLARATDAGRERRVMQFDD